MIGPLGHELFPESLKEAPVAACRLSGRRGGDASIPLSGAVPPGGFVICLV